MERLIGDLGHRIPHGDLDGADRNRALRIAADFFPRRHRRQHPRGIKIIAAII
jgi:hypothetical protein